MSKFSFRVITYNKLLFFQKMLCIACIAPLDPTSYVERVKEADVEAKTKLRIKTLVYRGIIDNISLQGKNNTHKYFHCAYSHNSCQKLVLSCFQILLLLTYFIRSLMQEQNPLCTRLSTC